MIEEEAMTGRAATTAVDHLPTEAAATLWSPLVLYRRAGAVRHSGRRRRKRVTTGRRKTVTTESNCSRCGRPIGGKAAVAARALRRTASNPDGRCRRAWRALCVWWATRVGQRRLLWNTIRWGGMPVKDNPRGPARCRLGGNEGTRVTKPETRIKAETPNPRPETRDPRPEFATRE